MIWNAGDWVVSGQIILFWIRDEKWGQLLDLSLGIKKKYLNTVNLWFRENDVKKKTRLVYIRTLLLSFLAFWYLRCLFINCEFESNCIFLTMSLPFAGSSSSSVGSSWSWTTCITKTSRSAITLCWPCRSSWCTTGMPWLFAHTRTLVCKLSVAILKVLM